MIVMDAYRRAIGSTRNGGAEMSAHNETRAWLVFHVDSQRYAIPVACIEEIIRENSIQVVQLPGMNQGMTGLARWREQIVPRLDLRTVLGLPPMADKTAELIQTLRQREADHVNWLKELEASVWEDRPFTLATDPHKCAFGKWYDRIRSDERSREAFTNRNMGLLRVLQAFDQPHTNIHAVAHQIESLKKQQQRDQAQNLINKTRDTVLAAMVRLFHEAGEYIHRFHQSTLLILHHADTHLCLVIDSIDLIVQVDNVSLQAIDHPSGVSRLPVRVSQGEKAEGLVMHIEPDDLVHWHTSQPNAA